MPLLQEALGRAVLLIMRHPGSGGSLGFGFLPKGQTGGKDDKMGFFFFFFLIGPSNLQARRDIPSTAYLSLHREGG